MWTETTGMSYGITLNEIAHYLGVYYVCHNKVVKEIDKYAPNWEKGLHQTLGSGPSMPLKEPCPGKNSLNSFSKYQSNCQQLTLMETKPIYFVHTPSRTKRLSFCSLNHNPSIRLIPRPDRNRCMRVASSNLGFNT
jgi:hypothetical protein